VKDSYGKEIYVGNRITWSEHGIETTGVVMFDIRCRGSMRIGGRSIPNIIDECQWLKVVK